jgi:hypothetical protein
LQQARNVNRFINCNADSLGSHRRHQWLVLPHQLISPD